MPKKKKSFKKIIKKFFNSLHVIIVALVIMLIVLICFSYHLMKSSRTYMFSGISDYVTILNGVISLNYDINVIAGSDIEYTAADDYTVVKYKIGYFVLENDKLIELVTKSGNNETGFSLKGIINEMSAYNVTEPYHNKTYFSKEVLKNLDNGLYFIIEATTDDGTEILDKTTLSLSKVSK